MNLWVSHKEIQFITQNAQQVTHKQVKIRTVQKSLFGKWKESNLGLLPNLISARISPVIIQLQNAIKNIL
jgi:hypothetical protein